MDFPVFYQTACLSVTDLNHYVRQVLESDELLQELWVEGEISNFSRPSSGHLYFTLKDGGAAVSCVIWRSQVQRLNLVLRDGLAVQAHGSIGVYEAGGRYQLYVDRLRPAGEGALFREFLRLKAQLESEGLFDSARKRPLPAWPTRVGLVTSPSGAALQDMLNTLRLRFPLAEVILAPCPVQGEDAPGAIVAALQALNDCAHPDVILLARGGGSLEDLWAFNDVRVVYAIVASVAPVITGIGHETDFTLADFAADLRAPTPTGAAVQCSPDCTELRQSLAEKRASLVREIMAAVENERWNLDQKRQSLLRVSPLGVIRQHQLHSDQLGRLVLRLITQHMRLERSRLSGLAAHLSALSPLSVLERGYAIVSLDRDGHVVRSTSQVSPHDALTVRVADGSFGAQATPRKEAGLSPSS